MEEFFAQVAEAIIRINLNQSVNQDDVKKIEADYETMNKARKLIALACKKQDEDLRTIRQIRGEDYAKTVTLHRQPRSKKSVDPLAELLNEMK